jgi:hypothetical protein
LPERFAAFEPALTTILTEAFDRAWQTVESSGAAQSLDGARDRMREAIARRIIDMATGGMTNVTELAMDALAHVTDKAFPGFAERPPQR